jgi:hypothetical protein
MAITKSNKQKLSLEHNKPNEKDRFTLATPYALMRSLILDYQISNTSLALALHCTQMDASVDQMGKRGALDE